MLTNDLFCLATRNDDLYQSRLDIATCSGATCGFAQGLHFGPSRNINLLEIAYKQLSISELRGNAVTAEVVCFEVDIVNSSLYRASGIDTVESVTVAKSLRLFCFWFR